MAYTVVWFILETNHMERKVKRIFFFLRYILNKKGNNREDKREERMKEKNELTY